MSEKKLLVEYKCQHLTCRMDCHEGIIEIKESMFEQLKHHAPEVNLFKSPRVACKINTIQDFLILSVEEVKENGKEVHLEELKKDYLALVKNHRQKEKTLKEQIKQLEIELENEKMEKSNEM